MLFLPAGSGRAGPGSPALPSTDTVLGTGFCCSSEACCVGYVSTQRTVLCWSEILNRQLNNSIPHGRIESQLGNVCCQDQVPLLLQAALEGLGGTVHTHSQRLTLPACSQKDWSSLNGDTDQEGAGQLSGSSDAEGKERGRNEKTLKAFSFQALLRILNAFSFASYCLFNLLGKPLGQSRAVS